MKYYLDTNIIIYALKGKYPKIMEHFKQVPSQSILIPTVVMAEIEYGAQKSINYNKTISKYKEFTDIFNKAPFTEKASKIYGQIRNNLEKSGNLIGPNDLMIAAIVMSEDGILITNNTKEFQRIPDLKLSNWTE